MSSYAAIDNALETMLTRLMDADLTTDEGKADAEKSRIVVSIATTAIKSNNSQMQAAMMVGDSRAEQSVSVRMLTGGKNG